MQLARSLFVDEFIDKIKVNIITIFTKNPFSSYNLVLEIALSLSLYIYIYIYCPAVVFSIRVLVTLFINPLPMTTQL